MRLLPGDLIDIVAPAAAFYEYDKAEVIRFVESLGYKARFGKNFQEKGRDEFSANSLEARYKDLEEAFLAKDSKAIWCFRGGYGSALLIPEFEKFKPSIKDKLLIGFSDITALHLYFTQKHGFQTIHGRTLSEYFHKDVEDEEVGNMKLALQGQSCSMQLKPYNKAAVDSGVVKAPLIGGNLVLVETSLATSWQIDARNKILVLEDVMERGYRIDRSLNHLMQAGIFEEAKAVILGNFQCAPENDGLLKCDLALKRFAENLNIPVYKTEEIGHGQINNPLIFGPIYEVSEEGVLRIDNDYDWH